MVTLTATANSGYTFASWTGVDSQNGSTGTVTMIADCGVTATFTASGSRLVDAQDAIGSPGGTVEVPVVLVAQGNENALGFSLTFENGCVTPR